MSGSRRDEPLDRERDRLIGSIEATVRGMGLQIERQSRDIETIRDRQGRDVETLREENRRNERNWSERLEKLSNVVDRIERTNEEMQRRMKESDATLSKLNEFRTRIFVGIALIGFVLMVTWSIVGPAVQDFIKAVFGLHHPGP
jgi:hypothetical protein